MSKISADMNSMMVALRQSKKFGCRGAHRAANGKWAPCASAAELKRRSKKRKLPLAVNASIRSQVGTNKLSRQWEPLGQRGVTGIATLAGGGLVSGAVGKAVKPTDLEVFDNIDTARQRARQLGCIGVARRFTATGRQVWTPCTNMSDLSRLAGLTSLGKRRQREATERVVTDALRKYEKRRSQAKKKSAFKPGLETKKLSGRIGGGLRIPPAGMVFVDVSGAIDGDRDGIINEGRPDERPIVPARMITEALASQLPKPELTSSSQFGSIDLGKPDTSVRSRSSVRNGRIPSAAIAGAQEILLSRLDEEERSFAKRLSRSRGYASEVPDRIFFAMGPEFISRVRNDNIRAKVAGMRSMTGSKPVGGRAMSDLIMDRIDEEELGKPEPKIYFIGGTMGAGKSTFVINSGDISGIPGMDKAAHIDPDEIKTALPGWNGGKGASAVHAESRFVTDKILERALSSGADVVLQGTGKRNEHLSMARQSNYRTVGHYVWVPADMSRQRIEERARRGGTQVDSYLGPLIASELRDLTHRQVTSGLLDEFYLWDTSSDTPKLIASFDGVGAYQINDEDAFYDFFGKYGGDRVREYWKAVSSPDSTMDRSGASRSRTIDRGFTKERPGEGLAERFIGVGFTRSSPLSASDLKSVDFKRADISGMHIRDGLDLRDIQANNLVAARVVAPGIKLGGANLVGSNLERANLMSADLSPSANSGESTDLRFANLSDAMLVRANLTKARLTAATLNGANLRNAVLRNADLTGAKLNETDLRGADLRGANISEGALASAIIDATTIMPDGTRGKPSQKPGISTSTRKPSQPKPTIPLNIDVGDDIDMIRPFIKREAIPIGAGRLERDSNPGTVAGAKLDKRNFSNLYISNVSLTDSELGDTVFDGATLYNVGFPGSFMEGAKLRKASLERVSFARANLRNTNLSGSTLATVSFAGANMRGANLENIRVTGPIDLRGTDLSGAYLGGADLRDALIDGTTRLNGVHTDARTKLPRHIDPKRLGPPTRSRTKRDFNDFLYPEVIEDARYVRRPVPRGQAISSNGLTTQPEFVRGQIITDALARLVGRDMRLFGPQLTNAEHNNVNQRIRMIRDLHELAEERRSHAAALEASGILASLNDEGIEAYIDDSLFGSLADDLMILRSAVEAEKPSTLNSMNDIVTHLEARNKELSESVDSISLIDDMRNRLNTPRRSSSRQGSRSRSTTRRSLERSLSSSDYRQDGLRSTSRTGEMYEKTARLLIEAIEKADGGKWERPWALGAGIPRNASTGKHYRGSNIFWLNLSERANGYERPVWATYKQWQEMGAQVRKGEKGTYGVKWSPKIVEDGEGNKKSTGRMVPFGFTLFNIAQVDGVEPSQFDIEQLPEAERVQRMETIVSEMNLPIRFIDPNRAYFSPIDDVVNMPPFSAFKSARAYYATLAHEAIHWTGHSDRLDRDNMHRFGSPEYAYEELVAEIGSAMFMALMGLEQEPQDDHAKYLKSWLSILKDNPEQLQKAINDAQKAVDLLIGMSPTLQKDLESAEPDADTFGTTTVDLLEVDAGRSLEIASRSRTKLTMDKSFKEFPSPLFGPTPSTDPLPIDEVASMSDERFVKRITEDRLNGLTAAELAAKYHITESQVLLAVREYLRMLETGEARDSGTGEKTLPMRRGGEMTRVPVSQLTLEEVEVALQYVRRDIGRAKNARELRSQRSLEESLLKQLAKLQM